MCMFFSVLRTSCKENSCVQKFNFQFTVKVSSLHMLNLNFKIVSSVLLCAEKFIIDNELTSAQPMNSDATSLGCQSCSSSAYPWFHLWNDDNDASLVFFSVPPSFLVSSSHPSYIAAQYRVHDRNKSFFINSCPQSSSSSFKTSYIYINFLSLLRFHKLDFQLYSMYAVARLPLSTFNVSIFLVSFSFFSYSLIYASAVVVDVVQNFKPILNSSSVVRSSLVSRNFSLSLFFQLIFHFKINKTH